MTKIPVVTAFLDASVLYPALLRNLLMYLALHGLLRAHWSARVHDEWMAALLRDRLDLSRASLNRTRMLMDEHISDALVEGYEHHMAALTLPDADDRHVLAAAIHCDASVLVTANLRDFPPAALAPHAIEAVHPDELILRLVESDREATVAALHQLRASFKNPAMTAAALLATMKKQGLATSASTLSALAERL